MPKYCQLVEFCVKDHMDIEEKAIFNRHIRKLNRLTQNRFYTASDHKNEVYNMSNIILLGPDFIPYTPPKKFEYRIKLEKLATRLEYDNLNIPIWKIEQYYDSVINNKNVNSNISRRMQCGMDLLRDIKDVVLVKIDKGYGYCIANSQQYREAGLEILNGNEFEQLSTCPTKSREREFNSFILRLKNSREASS
ncbi:hypothetical protein ACOME3_005333 [Neoechinorhynchus agilis]